LSIYDRDGHLDLFVANYIDMDLATAPVPESGPCLYKGVLVACGPPGLQGGKTFFITIMQTARLPTFPKLPASFARTAHTLGRSHRRFRQRWLA